MFRLAWSERVDFVCDDDADEMFGEFGDARLAERMTEAVADAATNLVGIDATWTELERRGNRPFLGLEWIS